ncbi:MAG: DUF6680 family protein [Pseudomonadota bacterium]
MTVNDWLTLAAIVVGPVVAVVVSNLLDQRRRVKERQLDVFRTLMRTRRRKLDLAHVTALNLVEIEFHKQKSIIRHFKSLMSTFNQALPPANISDHSAVIAKTMDDADEQFVLMMQEMARYLGYGYQQLEILKGGYDPMAHGESEDQFRKARALLSEIYEGRRALPVMVFQPETGQEAHTKNGSDASGDCR